MHRNKLAPRYGALKLGSALTAGISLAVLSCIPTFGEQATREAAKTQVEGLTVMPPVTVAAHAFETPLQNTGISVTKISVEKMISEGILTTDDAIQRAPGLYVARNQGPLGSPNPIVIRGLSGGLSSYNLTVVDGIRISDSMNGDGAFFSNQSIFGFNEIEIVKGSQGAVYGGQALSGVVSLNMPKGQSRKTIQVSDGKTFRSAPSPVPGITLFAEGGSFQSFTGALTAQGQIDKLSYYILSGYSTTANDPQFKQQGFDSNPSLDASQWFEGTRIDYDINDKSALSFSLRRTDSRFDYPSYYDSYETNSWVEDTNKTNTTLVSGSYQAQLSRIWTTKLLAGYYRQDQKAVEFYNRQEFYKTQLDWDNSLAWNDQWKTDIGFSWDRENYLNNTDYYGEASEIDNIFSLHAEQFYSPVEGLDLSIAGRWEHYDTWSNEATWRFAASWKVSGEDSPTRLFTSIGSGFKAPSYVQRYGWGMSYIGNPDLDPTKAVSYDLGIEQKIADNHSLTVTGFLTELDDIIVGASDAHYVTSYDNSGKGRSYGVETALKGDFKDAWNSGYTVAYTYTNPESTSGTYDGKQLACTARHTVSADLHTSPVREVTVGLGLLSSLNRTNYTPGVYLDDYCDMRLFAKWQITDNVAVHGRIENLLNQKYRLSGQYDPQYDARRIGFFGGVTVTF